jgi:hypothetical protein
MMRRATVRRLTRRAKSAGAVRLGEKIGGGIRDGTRLRATPVMPAVSTATDSGDM